MRWKRPRPLIRRACHPHGRWRPARAAGLTLLELLVAIAVAVIGLALAIPAYHHLVMRNRVDTATHLLTSLFASARATAVTYRRITAVCPTDGVSPWCSSDGDWSHGWMMFTDPDGDRQPDTPDEILRHERFPAPPSLQLRSSRGRPQLRYLPDGRSAGSNLSVRICAEARLQVEVVVNNMGRPRVNRARAGADCAR